MVTIAVAVWIPASPGNAKEKKENDESVDTVRFATLVVVTVLFPIFEMFVLLIGTVSMWVDMQIPSWFYVMPLHLFLDPDVQAG